MTFTCGSILQVEVFITPQSLTFSTAVFLTCACTYIRKVPQFIVKCLEIETKVGKIVLNIVTFCNWSKISFIYTKRINSTGIRVHSISYGRHIVLPTKPKKSASKSAQENRNLLPTSSRKITCNGRHFLYGREATLFYQKTQFLCSLPLTVANQLGVLPSGSGFDATSGTARF